VLVDPLMGHFDGLPGTALCRAEYSATTGRPCQGLGSGRCATKESRVATTRSAVPRPTKNEDTGREPSQLTNLERTMKKIIVKAAVPATALAALVAAAPAAHADNQSFLDAMNAAGLTTEVGDAGLLAAGKGACGEMAPRTGLVFGRSATWVADMVWRANPMLERDQATFIVNAALDNLCPGVNIYGRAA
jgi:hypothetical protein